MVQAFTKVPNSTLIFRESYHKRNLTDRLYTAYKWCPQKEIILDIGCSTGYFLAALIKKASKVYGIDIDKRSVIEAKVRKNCRVLVSSSEFIPFHDCSFEVVTLLDVLEHVSNEGETIWEAYRILKRGGTFIFSVPHKGMFYFLDPLNFKSNMFRPNIPRHRHYSIKEIKPFIDGKFIIQKIHIGGLIVYPLTVLIYPIASRIFSNPIPIFTKIGHLEHLINFGRLGYNLVIMGIKP